MSWRKLAAIGLGVLVVALGVAIALPSKVNIGTSQPPLTGTAVDRLVPQVHLIDERGRTTSLRAFRGTVVVLAPTLTFCHEVCPITSGALEQIRYDARRAGLGDRVTVLEASVDPWRDTAARLRAYRRETGVHFRLLTGTHAQLTRFWRFFGVGFYPTGHGRTFDVAHTDGVFFVDERGHWRIAVIGMPNVHGRLAARLKRLLGATGLHNLAHPEAAWTVQQALDDLGRLLGHHIPAAPLP
jgi:cytochrome oxidase Cu insertion factor (SCO1/SenC/PrrC family)